MNEPYDRLASAFGNQDPVLDVGTGSGAVAAELLTRGVRLYLLDIVDMRDRPVPAAPFLFGDGCALPFRDGVLGGVHLARVIHHVPDWRQAMTEAARVLAPGGVIAVGAGGTMPDGVLGELIDLLYAATDAAGYHSLHGHSPHDLSEVDTVLAAIGFAVPELLDQSKPIEYRPRDLLTDRITSRYRWDPAQDRSGLPDIAARVLADSGLDPDTPIPGQVTGHYRLYRRLPG